MCLAFVTQPASGPGGPDPSSSFLAEQRYHLKASSQSSPPRSRCVKAPISCRLTSIPEELHLIILECLRTPRDLVSFASTCRKFHSFVLPVAYQLDARESSDALKWACEQGNEAALCKSLDGGACLQLRYEYPVANRLLEYQYEIRFAGNREQLTPLHSAVYNNRFELAETLIRKGADVKAADSSDRTPLHYAVALGDLGMAMLLGGNGADVNAMAERSRPPLHDAWNYGVTEYLIKSGANIHARSTRNRRTYTPLCSFLHHRMECQLPIDGEAMDSVKLHLDSGAEINPSGNSPNGVDRILTPLGIAVELANVDLVKLFLARGADVNVKHVKRNAVREKTWLLNFAMKKEHIRPEIIHLLLDAGANVNPYDTTTGRTPLCKAIKRLTGDTRLDIVRRLLDKEASVEAVSCFKVPFRNKMWCTPLQAAVLTHDLDLAKMLLDRGASIHSKDKKGTTIVHNCVYCWTSSSMGVAVDSLRWVIEHGADVNMHGHYGSTALHSVFNPSQHRLFTNMGPGQELTYAEEMTRMLLHAGADTNTLERHANCKCHHGPRTPLMRACALRKDLESTAQATRLSAVVDAAIRLFVEHGAVVDTQNPKGLAALHFAARFGQASRTAVLLRAGADPNITDEWGWTPLHYASFFVCAARGPPSTAPGAAAPVAGPPAGKAVDVVRRLLGAGADVHARTRAGWTALHLACRVQNFQVVEALLDAGAAVNVADAHGYRPLAFAQARWGPPGSETEREKVHYTGHKAVVRRLRRLGAHMGVGRGEGQGARTPERLSVAWLRRDGRKLWKVVAMCAFGEGCKCFD